MNPAPDIFVSYASEDRERVRPLVEWLVGKGWRVWWDREVRTGRMFDREIEQAVHGARCIVVAWSRASLESEWVRTEANEGLDRAILVAVAIDDIRPPLAFRRVPTHLLLGWPDGDHREKLLQLEAGIRSFLPTHPEPSPPSANGGDVAGERRHVTVLTGRVNEHRAPRDSEAGDRVRQQFKAAVIHQARKYDGLVHEASSAHHVVVFGIPVAHERDAAHAAAAAFQLRQELTEIERDLGLENERPFSVEYCLVSGLVIGRRVTRRGGGYSVSGGVIDLGAKLLASAGRGDIVATAEVQRAISAYVKTEELTAGPSPLYRLSSASAISSPIEAAAARGFTRLCGREAEIAHLLERYALATEGTGQAVTISGEAGIGKSRLVHEFRQRLLAGAHVCLEAPCHSYGSSTPYYPFLGLLRRYLNLVDLPRPELHAAAIQAILALDADLRPYLPHYLYLLSIPSEQYRLPAHVEGESLRLALQEALVAILTVGRDARPLVVIFEDWHWADNASTRVLGHFVNLAVSFPILIVVSCRPEFHAGWTEKEHCSLVTLAGFSVAHTRAMIAALTGAGEMPADFVADLHQRTGGNAFFIEEVCRALLASDKIAVSEARLRLTGPIDQLGIPDSVQAVLQARLDQLDRGTQAMVHCAAVIGREFSRRLLELTCGRIVEPVLRGLVEAGIIKQTRVVPDAEYVFKHALIQVVAYEALLRKARRRLHRLVAENIIALHPDGLAEHTEMLAHHFLRSDDEERAVEYAILAGERALARSANHVAVDHLKAAERLVAARPESPATQRLQLRIALALGMALVITEGYVPVVMQTYLRALDYSRLLGAADEEFTALWGLWRFCNSSALVEESTRYAYQLLELARRNGRTDQLHTAYFTIVGSETFQGNLRQALGAMDGLRATFDRSAEINTRTRYVWASPMVGGLGIIANTLVLTGNYSGALAYLAEALALAQELKVPVAEALALYYVTTVHVLAQNFTEANRANRRLLEVTRAERLPMWHSFAEFHEARANLLAGGGDPAEKFAEVVTKANRAASFAPATVTPTRLSLATICVATGQLERSLTYIEEGLKSLRFFRPELLRLKAKALKPRDPAAARAALAEAWEVAADMEANVWKVRILLDRLSWLAEAGEPIDRDVERLRQTLGAFTSTIEVPESIAAKHYLESHSTAERGPAG